VAHIKASGLRYCLWSHEAPQADGNRTADGNLLCIEPSWTRCSRCQPDAGSADRPLFFGEYKDQKALVLAPIFGEAYRKLAQHYHFLISLNRPGTPRHKGKVENGVNYVMRNFLAGQEFVDLEWANLRMQAWVMETAGVQEHGTTHQAPLKLFGEVEQVALQALPVEPFDLHAILMAKVHSDCHIVVEGSFYSVPYNLVGEEVEVLVYQRLGEKRLEAACSRALYYGDPHYRRIQDILTAALDREPLPDQAMAAPNPQGFAFSRKPREFFKHSQGGLKKISGITSRRSPQQVARWNYRQVPS
jgi:hypothetical protein